MEYRTRLPIRNTSANEMTVIIEPWATEFRLSAGEEAEVIAINSRQPSWFSLELDEHRLVVWGESGPLGGALYEFWKAGIQVD